MQSASPLAFNDNIYQEGNISKMPNFDVFSLLEIRKRKRRSHGKWQKGNDKRKRCAAQKSGTSLNNLSSKLREHGRHAMLSFLSSLPIPVLRLLDIEANRFYDRNHQMYEVLRDRRNKHFHVRNSWPGGVSFGEIQHLRGLNSIALGYLNFTAGLT